MVKVIQICWHLVSRLLANLYVLLCVQWKTPDDGQRNCTKHVQFYSNNKFEELLHLDGFVIRTKFAFALCKMQNLIWHHHKVFWTERLSQIGHNSERSCYSLNNKAGYVVSGPKSTYKLTRSLRRQLLWFMAHLQNDFIAFKGKGKFTLEQATNI